MSREKNKKILPNNWIDCKLKDIGEIIAGGTPSTNEPSYWGDEVSWITPADLSGYKSMFISKGRKSLSKKGLQNSSARLIPKGSVLFSSRAPIGYVVIASNELATNQGFKNIVPYSGIDSKYLYYYLMANKQLAEENASGTTFKEISATKFAELPLVLAPSNEQGRISEKLDELLSELEKGKEQLQTSLEQLKVYKKSILHSAIEGKYLTRKYKWFNKTLGDVISISSGSGLTRVNRDDEGDFLVYGGNGVTGKHTSFMFKDEQLIIGRVGAHCGNAHITKPKSWVTDNAFVVTFDKEEYDIRFLYHLIWYLELNKYSSSTAQPVISQGKLYPIEIRVPEIDAQIEIVEFIENQYSNCDITENTIIQNLSQSDSLKQSLLQNAFEGKLVEKDPTDEPASVLLERIKKEREDYLKAEKEKKQNQKKPMKKKSTAKVFEFPLVDTIKDKFGKKSFTFEQLKSEVDINYDDLREELFSLLDNEKILTMEFDQKKESMNFKYIGK